MGPENEPSLAAIRVQKEGRPDWRRIGRDFPMLSRKSMTNLWELTGPDFWDLIADKDTSFSVHFMRSDIGVEMAPRMRHAKPRLVPRKRAAQIGGGLVAIPPGSQGNRGPFIGNLRGSLSVR